MGGPIEFHQTKYNSKQPLGLGGEWPPHYGDGYWRVRDGITETRKMVTVLIAITEQTKENGAVYVWKGSHKETLEERLPHITDTESVDFKGSDVNSDLSMQPTKKQLAKIDASCEKFYLTGPAGTVWFVDPGLLHTSKPNNSSKERALVANVFRSFGIKTNSRRPAFICEEQSEGPLV